MKRLLQFHTTANTKGLEFLLAKYKINAHTHTHTHVELVRCTLFINEIKKINKQNAS